MERQIDELVNRAKDGDELAFEELYRVFAGSILYHVKQLLYNKEDAEDAAQEAVLAMYQNLGSLKSAYAFKSWMLKILHSVCYSRNRKWSRKEEQYQSDRDIDELGDVLHETNEGNIPERQAVAADQNEAIIAAIKTLPPVQQSSIIMYYYDEMSYKEIAKALGVTVSTASTNIMRAKNNIKKELGTKFEGALAAAISFDVARTFPATSINSFCNSCDIVIGKAATAAKASGAVGGNVAKLANAATGKIVAGVVVSVISVATIAAPIVLLNNATKVVEADIAAMETVAPAPVYMPSADISMVIADGTAGNVNPTDALLIVEDKNAIPDALTWKILSPADESVVYFSGTGSAVRDEFDGLAPGEYQLRWRVENSEGSAATVGRNFTIE
jgi:RNA polymerase sigma-70 factor (ECF subfamily)